MKKNKTLLTLTIAICLLFIPSVFAAEECVLGPKVSADLTGVLKIIRIVAPLIVFALTLYETIVAISKQEGADAIKSVFQKLKMRFVYMILLFFIPTLVNLMLQAMGLTSNCQLNNTGTSVGEQQNNNTYNNTNKNQNDADNPKNSACAAHNGAGKKGECEAVSGCVFDSSSNTCTTDTKRNSNDAWNSACAAHNGAGKKGECEAAGCSFNSNNNTCNLK